MKRSLRSAAAALLVAALVAPAFGTGDDREGDAARALGPAPRAPDGRFANWAGAELPRPGPSVTLPFFFRRVTSGLRDAVGMPDAVETDVAWLAQNTFNTTPAITWVGHATFLVQLNHLNFLTDPIWSEAAGPGGKIGANRWVAPGMALEDLPRIDFVLISHNHYDHMDLPSLVRIAELHPKAFFFVPLDNGELLRGEGIRNVIEMDWGEQRQVGELTLHCLPSQHWSRRGLNDERRALWSSWAVTGPERRFYFAGDSGYFEGFRTIGEALGPFDLAAVPIGAYEPTAMMKFSHTNPEEAIAAARDLRARKAVGMHWGTFDLTDEPPGEPPLRFRTAASAAGYGPEDAWVMEIGETRTF